MDAKTSEMVRGWLAQHRGDVEGLACWMRDSLRIGGLKRCREMIRMAEADGLARRAVDDRVAARRSVNDSAGSYVPVMYPDGWDGTGGAI